MIDRILSDTIFNTEHILQIISDSERSWSIRIMCVVWIIPLSIFRMMLMFIEFALYIIWVASGMPLWKMIFNKKKT